MAGEKLWLIEDNNAVALGLRYALEAEGFEVLRSATVAESRQQAVQSSFDLIILDLRLPDGSGYDLCREFRQGGIRQPILMLTARDETIDKILGLEMGADDYVTKPFELNELIARIRALLRRSYGELADPGKSRVTIGELSLDLVSHKVTRGHQRIELTPTEFGLLTFFVQNPGQPFSREILMERVLGYQTAAGDARTVDVHIRNLRRKIEVDPARPRTIVTVRGAGYMFNPG